MKRPKAFTGDGVHLKMTIELGAALEEIALGEAGIDEASAAVATAVSRLDDAVAVKLYESLRSFVWKALDARRRDGELLHWLDVIGRVSSSLADLNRELATKLEACAELLHTSITRAAAPSVGLFERKHVRNVVGALLREVGSTRKRDLLVATGLKEANLSRIMAPLRDAGWVERSMDGKEAIYRLTKAGREAAPADLREEQLRSDQHAHEFFAQRYLLVAFAKPEIDVQWHKAVRVVSNLVQPKHDRMWPMGLPLTELGFADHIKPVGYSPGQNLLPNWRPSGLIVSQNAVASAPNVQMLETLQ